MSKLMIINCNNIVFCLKIYLIILTFYIPLKNIFNHFLSLKYNNNYKIKNLEIKSYFLLKKFKMKHLLTFLKNLIILTFYINCKSIIIIKKCGICPCNNVNINFKNIFDHNYKINY